jgi:hypothetical protein
LILLFQAAKILLTNIGAQEIRILAKPSDHIEAYFEDTAGLVEGVKMSLIQIRLS